MQKVLLQGRLTRQMFQHVHRLLLQQCVYIHRQNCCLQHQTLLCAHLYSVMFGMYGCNSQSSWQDCLTTRSAAFNSCCASPSIACMSCWQAECAPRSCCWLLLVCEVFLDIVNRTLDVLFGTVCAWSSCQLHLFVRLKDVTRLDKAAKTTKQSSMFCIFVC